MELTIRYNRSSVHIQGIPEATTAPVADTSSKTGVVSYYAQSACGGLTRSGHRMAVSDTYDNAADALKGAEMKAKSLGLKLCKNCEKAAKWAIASAPVDTESEEFQAKKERVNAELEESNRRYKEAEAARKAHEDTTITREPEDRTLTEVEEMEDQYQDLVHVGRGLRLLSDQFCRLLAEMKDGEGLDEDDARFQRIKRKLDRNLKLEDKNLDQRGALSLKIREARGQGRCLQRGGEYGGPSLQCLQLRGHTGDCKNSRGETFTNWLDPEERMTGFTSKSPVLVMDAETAPEVKAFHRKIQDSIGFKF